MVDAYLTPQGVVKLNYKALKGAKGNEVMANVKDSENQLAKMGTPKARLIKAPDRSAHHRELGEELLKRTQWFVPSTDGTPVIDGGVNFSDAAVTKVAEKYVIKEGAGQKESAIARADFLTKQSTAWSDAGEAIVTEVQETILAYSATLVPEFEADGKTVAMVTAKNDDGFSFRMPRRTAIVQTCQAWLLSLAKESNNSYRPKAGKKSGKPKASLFDLPKSGAKSGLMTGNDEIVTAGAETNYFVKDNEGRLQKLIELFVDAGSYLDRRDTEGAGRIFETLIGDDPDDDRFNFNDGVIRRLFNARAYGLCASRAKQEAKEIRDKVKKGESIKAYGDAQQKEIEELTSTLKRNEAFAEAHKDEPKVETVGGSKAKAAETKATLPQATQKPITAEAKAAKKLEREAKQAAFDALSDDEGNIPDASKYDAYVAAYIANGGPVLTEQSDDGVETEETEA